MLMQFAQINCNMEIVTLAQLCCTDPLIDNVAAAALNELVTALVREVMQSSPSVCLSVRPFVSSLSSEPTDQWP